MRCRVTPMPFAAVLLLSAAACGGGPRRVAEITPAVAERLSGAWVLNEQQSDDSEEALVGAARTGAAGGVAGRGGGSYPPGGGQPPMGGGGRGGMTGGGMTGGGMPRGGMSGPDGARGGSLSPEAMRVLRQMAVTAPRRLQVSLTDSMLVVSHPREEPWVLPFGGKVVRQAAEGVEVEARASWEQGRLIVIRRVSGGGTLTETYMPSVDGRRLTVAVDFSPGGRGGVEFTRVYDAGADASPES